MAKSKTIKCRTCKRPTKKVISGDKKAGYLCMSSRTMCSSSLEVNFYDEEE